MAKRFKPTRRRIEGQFRRIAHERLDHALEALEGDGPPGEALHTARTDVKRLRSQFKLARPAFKTYRHENAALRDAARAVSALRDDTAMIETFDRLAATIPPDEASTLAPIRAALSRRRAASDDSGAQVATFRRALNAARKRIPRWKIAGKGFAPLEEGLKKTYADARRAMREARDDPTPEAFHEWRKSMKAHWYQARLLTPIARKRMVTYLGLTADLAEMLGEHHDLVTFTARLSALEIDTALRDKMAAYADRQRRRIEARAFALAAPLFEDKPRRLARRWRRRWNRRAD